MKLLRLRSVGGAIMALAILFGIGMVSASTAQAQYRNDRDWRNGRNDRNRDWRRDRDRDWNRNRDRDRDGIPDRYERNNGYGNNGRNGNNGRYGGYGNVYEAARNQGYQDGLYTGSNDGRRGQSYNPQRSHFWREATSGYNQGNRGQYTQAYRDGFLRGYDQGYRQYAGNYGYGRGNSRSRSGSILGQIFGQRY